MPNTVAVFPSGKSYPDLHDHIAALDRAGLLLRITEEVNKDTVLHPLVRWQFRGGMAENDRKAFLFTNVVDSRGRHFAFPVIVGALAANAEIYRIGLGAKDLAEIGPLWTRALVSPIEPRLVASGPCQDVVHVGADLQGENNGLGQLPIPISTPGFDSAPYLTATCVISRDPDTGIQNMGTYRASLKAPDRLVVMMSGSSGGQAHWKKYRERNTPMPLAIVVGCPPAVAYSAPQKVRDGLDEIALAGGLVGGPIDVVKAVSHDLLVPADAEFVIEGFVRIDELEPEGPFGESHGHVALEDYNFILDVTAITHRRDAVFVSIISQVTPSESSVIKRVAMEPLFLAHLRDQLGIRGIKGVAMHEPLTNLRPVIMLQCAPDMPATEVWRALQAASVLQADSGKIVIAVDDDIDPNNPDTLLWALAYRMNPELDIRIVPGRGRGHGPRTDLRSVTDSGLLIDARRKAPTPPLALPKREYMEAARELWNKLGLPPLSPQMPWYGYTMGHWNERWDSMARTAADGGYMDNGKQAAAGRRSDIAPNSPVPPAQR